MLRPPPGILRCAALLMAGAGMLRARETADRNRQTDSGQAERQKMETTAPTSDAGAGAEAGEKPAPPAGAGNGAAAIQTRRALSAMRAGKWKEARAAWEAALKAEPDNAAALANLGKVLCQLQDYPAARAALEKATTLKPALADAWLTLGQAHLAGGSLMMAVSCMTRAVAENPADPGAHNALAIALKQAGWTDGAEAELQKALDLNPGYAEAHFNLAVMCLEKIPPSLEMAGRHYRRARQLGAEPDSLIEKQLRGESILAAPDTDSGAPPEPGASSASGPPAGSAAPAAAAMSRLPAEPSGRTAKPPETTPGPARQSSAHQPQSSPRTSSRNL